MCTKVLGRRAGCVVVKEMTVSSASGVESVGVRNNRCFFVEFDKSKMIQMRTVRYPTAAVVFYTVHVFKFFLPYMYFCPRYYDGTFSVSVTLYGIQLCTVINTRYSTTLPELFLYHPLK